MQIECRLTAQTHQTGFRLGDQGFCGWKKRQPPLAFFSEYLYGTRKTAVTFVAAFMVTLQEVEVPAQLPSQWKKIEP